MHIFTNPDDMLALMLVKSTSPDGYSLVHSNKSSKSMRLQFAWRNPVLLQKTKSTQVEYLHIKKTNQILFRLPA